MNWFSNISTINYNDFTVIYGGLLGILIGIAISIILGAPVLLIIVAGVFFLLALISYLKGSLKRYLQIILIISIPVNINKCYFFVPGHIGGVPGLNISLWFLILLLLYLIWFWEIRKDNVPKINLNWGYTIPLILVFTLSTLSLIIADFPKMGIFQLFQFVKVFLLFFYIANNIRTQEDYRFFVVILVGVLTFEILLGFLQYFTGGFQDLGILSDVNPARARKLGGVTVPSIAGTLTGDARFADYLILMGFLLLSSVFSIKSIVKKGIFALYVVACIILTILATSRGAWVGMAIALPLFLFLTLIYSRNKRVNFIIVTIFIVILSSTIVFNKDIIYERIWGEDYGSAESRIPMLNIAFNMIKAKPLLGVGINNYTHVMNEYDQTGLSYRWFQPVHNVFAQLAAECGIPCLFVMIVFLLKLFYTSLKVCNFVDEYYNNQLFGLICGIIAILIHGLFNNGTFATDPFILFWVFAGFIVAIQQSANVITYKLKIDDTKT